MSFNEYIRHYWPFLIFMLWIGYKIWNTRRVKKLIPSLKARNAKIIDVRTVSEFERSHAPDTINIPLQEIKSRLDEIPKDVPIILCCASGTRSGFAKRYLARQGFQEIYNAGAFTNLIK